MRCPCQNTRLDCLLVWILLSGSFLFHFVFSSLATNKTDTANAQKNAEKESPISFFQLVQLCSQIVFLNGVGLRCFFFFFWNGTFIVVSAKLRQQKVTKHYPKSRVHIWPKVESIYGPSMLCSIIGLDIDATFGSIFSDTSFGIFFENSHSPCRKKKIFKKQKKEEKHNTWTRYWLKERQHLNQILTLQQIQINCEKKKKYIYIYIYGIGEPLHHAPVRLNSFYFCCM